jgi:hypothetical protein
MKIATKPKIKWIGNYWKCYSADRVAYGESPNDAHRLTGWLDQVAETNPERAFQLFQSVIEYHVPKLARTDNTVTGADGGAIVHRIEVSFGDD